MTEVEINDKKYHLPTSYEELSLRDYCNAFRGLQILMDDDVDDIARLVRLKYNESVILSRLMGADDEFAMDLPMSAYYKLADKISFIYDYQSMIDNAKAYIKVDGKMYGIPRAEKMSLRQYIDADMVMKEDNSEQFLSLLSVLLLEMDGNGGYVPYKGDYEKKKKWVGELKCSDALPLIYHFFRIWQASRSATKAYTAMEAMDKRQVHNTQDS